jgi:hypothetical protein
MSMMPNEYSKNLELRVIEMFFGCSHKCVHENESAVVIEQLNSTAYISRQP